MGIKRAKGLDEGTLFIFYDSLANGPLPRFRSLDEWLPARDAYFKSTQNEARLVDYNWISACEVFRGVDALHFAQRIVLWVGVIADEQLLLAWMVQYFRAVGLDLSKLHVIQFDPTMTQWGDRFSLGMVDVAELKAHPPAVPLSEAEIAEIDEAWSAVTAPTPEPLTAFLSSNDGALPLIRPALRSLIYRYPSIGSGLNVWEEALLANTGTDDTKSARPVGHAMSMDTDLRDHAGQDYLFARLRRLAGPRLQHPFVTMTGSRPEMRYTQVRLTEAGKQALDGKANFVELNGIDDWVGGVHLDSGSGDVWYRSGDQLVRSAS
jgi:hypothetical protein